MGESNAQDPSSQSITAVVITKNEESMIANALATVRFCDEIVVVDSGSSDSTVEIAKREGAHVVRAEGGSFQDWRNEGKKAATSDWILYIDADERVTPKLAHEIRQTIQFTSNAAFLLKRNNIHFGKWMEHGGWEIDKIVRLFKKSHLREWSGDVHESAKVDGVLGEIKEPLVHLTHRNIRDGLLKSHSWIDVEAQLLYKAGTKKVTPLVLIRKTTIEFLRRLLLKKGYKDGVEGWIESMQQAVNRFFVYARLWELQQKPTLEERYAVIEKEIVRQWNQKK